MLFSSWQFVLAFLPATFVIYFWLNRQRWIVGGKIWLVAVSLWFYGYWEPRYLPLIIGSILLNYGLGTALAQSGGRATGTRVDGGRLRNRRMALTIGIASNLMLLGYYKYTGFVLQNFTALLGVDFSVPHILLPLAISFFTFTQIVYLVDSYRGETADYSLLNYALFVTYFPHLIAGPIVHHRQIMPQFSSPTSLPLRLPNVLLGLFIFSVGLFKKAVVADTFAIWATAGFDGGQALDLYAAWAASLSYTLQLYFDFSGYCDMAIGASLLFNIWLPINFNSPYKALDIQDFWRRWHITLSSFLRDCLYIPLGGNRHGAWRTSLNLLVTFVLGGLWHGATWMFVAWGGLHGVALVIHRSWKRMGGSMPSALGWLLTFLFVNCSWVFFRARRWDDARRILAGMVDIGSAASHDTSALPTADMAWAGWMFDRLASWLPAGAVAQLPSFLAIAAGFVLLAQRNALELAGSRIRTPQVLGAAGLFVVAMYFVLVTTSSVFLYFNF